MVRAFSVLQLMSSCTEKNFVLSNDNNNERKR
jgi:hypothetical protein